MTEHAREHAHTPDGIKTGSAGPGRHNRAAQGKQSQNNKRYSEFSDRLGEDGEMLGLKRLSSGDLGEPQAHSCLSLFALQKRRPPHRGPPHPGGAGQGAVSTQPRGRVGREPDSGTWPLSSFLWVSSDLDSGPAGLFRTCLSSYRRK